jgi:hypothetical protein
LEAGFFFEPGWVLVVCVAVVLLWELLDELLDEPLPPHPANRRAAAAASQRLRGATISVRLIGWTPIIAERPGFEP